jgi:RNA 2',3'-cyclic 3'-phosphodiesterase
MRLFVALEIPEPVRREVRRRVAGLRERLPRARWVDSDVLHLTLLFLGEVAPERVAELAGRLGQAFAAQPALPLRLAGGGTFPAGRPARVAWIGVAGPPELAPLQAAVVRAAREVLELREAGERPFQPHVTLARCPSPWPRGAAEKFAAAFPGEIGPPFVADRGVLVESRLSPRGPRYRHLAELPLAAASGERAGAGGAGGECRVAEEPGSAEAESAEEPGGAAGEQSA